MKKSKIDDSRIYFYFSIITFIVAIVLAVISFYSIIFVEPEISELIKKGSEIDIHSMNLSRDEIKKREKEISGYYKEAFIKLKDPQIFAGYENFDQRSYGIKRTLNDYNEIVKSNKLFAQNSNVDLSILLERRIMGSRLGRNTMIYFLLFSLIAFLFYIKEIKINFK